ncbi:Vacuolar protein-sorting-associated protein 36 [Boothiomyces macroporosus]|uniref:Vacuolar protein-sorting-associated protein 36 n=1 Tax=Boothiomyces macroporosus TaxID=261099 RepID=A0AAD5UBS5_9FUNG|nr:Vacuolar protein-sorting-associated protein 36 [Boothiomyces macroporosus]
MANRLFPFMNKLFESKSEIPGENVLHTVSNVGLYDGNDKLEDYSNGTVTITSHRIIYDPKNSLGPVQILLSRITSHSTFAGFMLQSPKIILTLKQGNKCFNCGVSRPDIPAQCKVCTFINQQEDQNCQMCGGLQETVNALEKALSDKQWLKKEIGVSSILNKKQQEQKKMNEMNESFSDLKTLMEKAGEMTRLADLITSKLGTEHDEFTNSLAQFGVNVQSTGNYHSQLSLEINEFLVKRNENILTLCDLYCLYNRVRGIALISPTDLLKACLLLDKEYILKEFSSGLKIVQRKDDDCVERIIKEADGDSVGSLAKRIGLSLLIVKEGLTQGITSGQLKEQNSALAVALNSNLIGVGDGSDEVIGQKAIPIVGQNVPLNARALNQPQAGSLPNGQYNLPQPNAAQSMQNSNQGYSLPTSSSQSNLRQTSHLELQFYPSGCSNYIPANYIAKTPPVNNSSNLENVSSARPAVQTDTTGLNYLIKEMYAQPAQNKLQQHYERQQVKQMLSNDYNSKPQANTQNMTNQGPKQDISKPIQQPLPDEVYDDLEPGKKFMVNVNPNDPKAKDYEISQMEII